jgi:hypothetical protein
MSTDRGKPVAWASHVCTSPTGAVARDFAFNFLKEQRLASLAARTLPRGLQTLSSTEALGAISVSLNAGSLMFRSISHFAQVNLIWLLTSP